MLNGKKVIVATIEDGPIIVGTLAQIKDGIVTLNRASNRDAREIVYSEILIPLSSARYIRPWLKAMDE